MTAPVPQAAVDAAMEAMGCARVPVNWDSLDFGQQTNWVTSGQPIAFGDYCFEHRHDWTDDGTCQAAREVAAAVVAAVQGPIKAETWGEAADLIGAEHRSEARRLAEYSDEYGLLGNWLGGFRESEKMLRKRAAEIEAQP